MMQSELVCYRRRPAVPLRTVNRLRPPPMSFSCRRWILRHSASCRLRKWRDRATCPMVLIKTAGGVLPYVRNCGRCRWHLPSVLRCGDEHVLPLYALRLAALRAFACSACFSVFLPRWRWQNRNGQNQSPSEPPSLSSGSFAILPSNEAHGTNAEPPYRHPSYASFG